MAVVTVVDHLNQRICRGGHHWSRHGRHRQCDVGSIDVFRSAQSEESGIVRNARSRGEWISYRLILGEEQFPVIFDRQFSIRLDQPVQRVGTFAVSKCRDERDDIWSNV